VPDADKQPDAIWPLSKKEDDSVRWDLHVVEGDEGAGEPVDPDLVVPTIGAN
jgi:hypothetical protein